MIKIVCGILFAVSAKYALTEPQPSESNKSDALLDESQSSEIRELPHEISAQLTDKANQHPDVGLTTIEMIRRQGYKAEIHPNIETHDGYLLDMHRIPYGKLNQNNESRPVAFLMHGLLSSSADWVNMGPERSLAYQLADAGYDVWMGNARGNKYSRKHIHDNADSDSKFWDFSWHEIGVYDLPRMIDYVLGVTGQSKLFYIGHSQGTTTFFVMCSERPDYNNKVRFMVALSPVAFMSHMKTSLIKYIAKFLDVAGWILRFLGDKEFLPSNEFIQMIAQILCKDANLFQKLCGNIYFMIGGWDSEQLDADMIPVIMSNAPAGASSKQFVHYAQEVSSGEFRQFDYGKVSNMMQYRSLWPPNYHIDRITTPLAFFYATNDRLAEVEDVVHFQYLLPTPPLMYKVNNEKFNHLDFVFARNVKELVNDQVLRLLMEH